MDSKTEILDLIDKASAPDKMGKREAIDFMDDLIGDLRVRVEALEDELDG
jgi:hypothetical protein